MPSNPSLFILINMHFPCAVAEVDQCSWLGERTSHGIASDAPHDVLPHEEMGILRSEAESRLNLTEGDDSLTKSVFIFEGRTKVTGCMCCVPDGDGVTFCLFSDTMEKFSDSLNPSNTGSSFKKLSCINPKGCDW